MLDSSLTTTSFRLRARIVPGPGNRSKPSNERPITAMRADSTAHKRYGRWPACHQHTDKDILDEMTEEDTSNVVLLCCGTSTAVKMHPTVRAHRTTQTTRCSTMHKQETSTGSVTLLVEWPDVPTPSPVACGAVSFLRMSVYTNSMLLFPNLVCRHRSRYPVSLPHPRK